jgi:hypothetical protein
MYLDSTEFIYSDVCKVDIGLYFPAFLRIIYWLFL